MSLNNILVGDNVVTISATGPRCNCTKFVIDPPEGYLKWCSHISHVITQELDELWGIGYAQDFRIICFATRPSAALTLYVSEPSVETMMKHVKIKNGPIIGYVAEEFSYKRLRRMLLEHVQGEILTGYLNKNLMRCGMDGGCIGLNSYDMDAELEHGAKLPGHRLLADYINILDTGVCFTCTTLVPNESPDPRPRPVFPRR